MGSALYRAFEECRCCCCCPFLFVYVYVRVRVFQRKVHRVTTSRLPFLRVRVCVCVCVRVRVATLEWLES